MTDKKISELTSITGANVSDANDVLPIVDTSVSTTKKITRAELFKSVSSVDINGGTIDGTVIGGSTPAAISGTTGQFGTSLNVDGTITADGLTVDGAASIGSSTAKTKFYSDSTYSGIFNGASVNSNESFYMGAGALFFNGGGSERMRIDSSGNVGIGTGSPAGQNTSANNLVVEDAAGNGGITIKTPTSAYGSLHFSDGTGVDAYRGILAYNHSDNSMQFYTNATERMRIDSSGNVGIRTSSPASALDVVGTITADGLTVDGAASIGSSTAKTKFYSDSTYSGIFNGASVNSNESFYMGAGALFFNGGGSERMRIDSSGRVGIGTISPSQKLDVSGNVTISGSLSKGSGSFKIDHPIKPDTHYLIHSFIEGPQADNLYRGKVSLVDGSATVNLDEAGRMTEGTFVALNGNVQCFTTNEDGWTAVRGKVEGNILTIEAQDAACADTVSWLVIGERHDQHMIEANWTDDQGRIITEPEKEIA